MACGTLINFEYLDASTGNSDPNIDPTRMMNIDAIRSPKNVSAPPPEPQSEASSRRASGEELGEDMARSKEQTESIEEWKGGHRE